MKYSRFVIENFKGIRHAEIKLDSKLGASVFALVGLVYVLSTTEGSCFMMARMLKKETGKRQVGAKA